MRFTFQIVKNGKLWIAEFRLKVILSLFFHIRQTDLFKQISSSTVRDCDAAIRANFFLLFKKVMNEK